MQTALRRVKFVIALMAPIEFIFANIYYLALCFEKIAPFTADDLLLKFNIFIPLVLSVRHSDARTIWYHLICGISVKLCISDTLFPLVDSSQILLELEMSLYFSARRRQGISQIITLSLHHPRYWHLCAAHVHADFFCEIEQLTKSIDSIKLTTLACKKWHISRLENTSVYKRAFLNL